MNHFLPVSRALGWVLAGSVLGASLSGCSGDSGESQQREDMLPEDEKRAEESEDAGHVGHRRSLPDVVLRWENESADSLVSTLPLVVENHAQGPLTISLEVEVAAPVGVRRTRSLPQVGVEAGERSVVSIAVDWLPVQTEGLASSVGVTARWMSLGQVSTNPNDQSTEERMTIAVPRFVTWESEGTATVRTDEAQVRFQGEQSLAGAPPRVTALRVFDESTGRFSSMPEEELAALPVSIGGSDEYFGVDAGEPSRPLADAPAPPKEGEP